ncbi:hypothetical protein DFJ73DRAFT_958170 [Zopfochytrium polystomum]|nr:hypothetical protein DFJ73DRAFT_958170 [Zopfochytrium polystomum]
MADVGLIDWSLRGDEVELFRIPSSPVVVLMFKNPEQQFHSTQPDPAKLCGQGGGETDGRSNDENSPRLHSRCFFKPKYFGKTLELSEALLTFCLAGPAAAGCSGVKSNLACITLCEVDTGIYIPFPKLISGITLPSFSIAFNPSKGTIKASVPAAKVNLDVSDAAWLKSLGPLTKLEIVGVGGEIGVGLLGVSPVASIALPDYVASSGILLDGITKFDITNQAFNINNAGAANLFQALTTKIGPLPVRLSGYADTKIQVDALLGTKVCARYVEVDVTSSLVGLGGLQQTQIVSVPVLKSGSPSTGLELGVQLSIVNPSTIKLSLNTNVSFVLQYNGSAIGTVVLPNFSLGLGTNKYTATAFLKPSDKDAAAVAAAAQVISNFVTGTPSVVSVGSGSAKDIPILNLALGSLKIPQTLPASSAGPLLVNATAYVATLSSGADASGVPFLSFGSKVVGYNPFDTTVSITTIQSSILYEGVPCLTINTTFSNFIIPPKANAVTPLFNAILPNSEQGPSQCTSDLIFAILSAPSITVDTESVLSISVGGYVTTFKYKQSGLSIFPNLEDIPTA